jgi:hypothetical protein
MVKMTLVKAVQTHLSIPGETIRISEYKKLTPEDKADLITCFAQIGIDCAPSNAQATA